jgi:hypothetical protein
MRGMAASISSLPLSLVLRSATGRKLAMRLSDRDVARPAIDAALRAHAASRLEKRDADEVASRPAYAGSDHSL